MHHRGGSRKAVCAARELLLLTEVRVQQLHVGDRLHTSHWSAYNVDPVEWSTEVAMGKRDEHRKQQVRAGTRLEISGWMPRAENG